MPGFSGWTTRSVLLSRTYRDPVLVASTDGVGTKLKLAFAAASALDRGNRPGGDVGERLYAGAEPVIFLDYVAMSRDDPELTSQIVGGISDGCIRANVRPGRTRPAARSPDTWKGEYDLAGFASRCG